VEQLLFKISSLSTGAAWLIFLLENALITVLTLYAGNWLLQRYAAPCTPTPANPTRTPSRRQWLICTVTNILNTVVTFAGWWLWKNGFITITTAVSPSIIPDFFVLFLAMDLLMYIFHVIIHKTVFHQLIHSLHHEAVHPTPIDLFVLHPLETLAFGALWLFVMMIYSANIYAVIIYLVVNVIFGLTGHLGIEPLPARIRNLPVINYLGTSTFHHDHHEDIRYNFGFYTSIWDRLFHTLKR
jgi:Delta7-sterol 5-desaturase